MKLIFGILLIFVLCGAGCSPKAEEIPDTKYVLVVDNWKKSQIFTDSILIEDGYVTFIYEGREMIMPESKILLIVKN